MSDEVRKNHARRHRIAGHAKAEGGCVNISRTCALMGPMFAASVAFAPIDAGAATLSLIGSSVKVCQLTGEFDWQTNQPTAAQTMTNFGLDGVDLGFPVDSGTGPLYFLFGDTWPMKHGPFDPRPPDDSLGWTTRTTAPDSSTCLGLQMATAAPQRFAPPTVSPAMLQGSFNVPTGGVFLNNWLYAFFWTDHCVLRGVLAPIHDSPIGLPQSPLSLPPGNRLCPEIPLFNSVGRSVLAAATPDNPTAFHARRRRFDFHPPTIATMPSGFVYVSAAATVVTSNGKTGIPVFGVPRYRASIPYLALAPVDTFGKPESWSFFAGRDHAGQPTWVTLQQWENGHAADGGWLPPRGAEIYSGSETCVGEHSVTWNAPLNSWLLLYGCIVDSATGPDARIEARIAPQPWGPWSTPTVLLTNHDAGVVCTLIMRKETGCTGQRNYWPTMIPVVAGFFYAPFVMDRFTVDSTPAGASTKQATIYWLVSTWNPYNVVVMQSTLQLD
jgi:hypothetical protein